MKRLKLLAKGATRAVLRKRVETNTERSHTVSWVHDGWREGTVEVWVDLDRIIELYGPDSLMNKGRRKRGMNGCVEIVATTMVDRRLSARS